MNIGGTNLGIECDYLENAFNSENRSEYDVDIVENLLSEHLIHICIDFFVILNIHTASNKYKYIHINMDIIDYKQCHHKHVTVQ